MLRNELNIREKRNYHKRIQVFSLIIGTATLTDIVQSVFTHQSFWMLFGAGLNASLVTSTAAYLSTLFMCLRSSRLEARYEPKDYDDNSPWRAQGGTMMSRHRLNSDHSDSVRLYLLARQYE